MPSDRHSRTAGVFVSTTALNCMARKPSARARSMTYSPSARPTPRPARRGSTMKLALATWAAGPPWFGPHSAVPRTVPSPSTATTVNPRDPPCQRNQPSRASRSLVSVSQEKVSPACTMTRMNAQIAGQSAGTASLISTVSGTAASARGDLRRRLARAQLGLERGVFELLLDVVGVPADVLEHARLEQFVHRLGARLHGGDLVRGPLDVRASVAEARGDARGGRADVALRLRRGVLSLQHLLLGAEGVHPLLQRGEGVLELLLLFGKLLALRFHAVDLGLGGGLAGQGLARQILPALRQRRLGLLLEVLYRVLELLFLQFYLLAGPGDRH